MHFLNDVSVVCSESSLALESVTPISSGVSHGIFLKFDAFENNEIFEFIQPNPKFYRRLFVRFFRESNVINRSFLNILLVFGIVERYKEKCSTMTRLPFVTIRMYVFILKRINP